jgi:hypothetical protein
VNGIDVAERQRRAQGDERVTGGRRSFQSWVRVAPQLDQRRAGEACPNDAPFVAERLDERRYAGGVTRLREIERSVEPHRCIGVGQTRPKNLGASGGR